MAAKDASSSGTRRERRSSQRLRRERALVTSGASGLGRLVCRALHRSFDVISLDRSDFPDHPKDVEHLRLDLRRKSALTQVKKRRPDVVVHIGAIHGPPSPTSHRHLDATVQLLRLVEELGCRKLVLLSSATLYGPSATSANFMTEEAPLLGASAVPDLSDDISLDMMVQSFFWKLPATETVILRPVHIVGPHLDNLATRYFKLHRAPRLLGFDPMVQLVHEEDVVDAIVRALRPGVRGVFNIAGQTQAPLSRLLEARGAATLPIPGPLFAAALARAAALRMIAIDPGELAFLRYSCLIDGKRAHDELGYEPHHTLKQTLEDLG